MKKDFPEQIFDHVILCVPVNKDTIWLECTDQHIPFGFLGSFTDDRDVLLITEKGGKLAHTRKYSQNENYKENIAEINITEDGNATAKIKTLYKSLFYDDIRFVFYENEENQKKWLYNNIDIPDFKITNFLITDNHENFIPTANKEVSLEITNYAKKSGDRLFITLNLLSRLDYSLSDKNERISDIYIPRAKTTKDSIIFFLPEGFEIEYIPKSQKIETKFGNIYYTIKSSENKIIYVRKFTINKGKYPKTEYSNFIEYINSINKIDKDKAVILKTI